MSAELKALQTKLHEANRVAGEIRDHIKKLNKLRVAQLNSASQIQAEITKLTSREVVVSEHAVVRYLERVLDQDLNEHRKAILTEQVRKCADTLGDGVFPSGTGFRAVVKDRVVVSVLGPNEK